MSPFIGFFCFNEFSRVKQKKLTKNLLEQKKSLFSLIALTVHCVLSGRAKSDFIYQFLLSFVFIC